MVFERYRWRYLYAVLIRVGLLRLREEGWEEEEVGKGADTGRSIKEVEMYLTGLSYREVLEHRCKAVGQSGSRVSR